MLFFFFAIFNNFLVIPVVREKIKIKLALAITTGAPTILVNEQIDNPPVLALKTIKILSMQSKAATYLFLIFYHMIFFD